jgi:phospholipid/cholesterol/gamma-HCH transport system permease protein
MEPAIDDTPSPAAQTAEPRAELDSEGVLALSGDWIARRGDLKPDTVPAILDTPGLTAIAFDTTRLGEWDSGLLVFLSELHRQAEARGIAIDDSGLPPSARRLLALMPRQHPAPPPPRRTRLRTVIGRRALSAWAELGEVNTMIGEAVLRSGAALRGRARMRWVDLLDSARDAGASALPIVIIVNILMGGILAFVGAVQLRRFGADVYVADLVGIAVVREIAALITAVVMSGRTGGAYAANIATMLGNEEIDALRAVGIPLSDYLILPRILALTLMMPLLYLYGSVAGIFGGFLVAIAMLHLSPVTFLDHVQYAVAGSQIAFGLTKSVAFGVLIAITGCRIGLRAGRSAADVGRAATSAVVVGIVGVIALDGVFAVCANALNF